MKTSLEHISLASGHARQSPRQEVANEVVDRIRAALADANGRLWDTGWSVKLLPIERPNCFKFDLYHEGSHLIRCWLCNGTVRDGREMWESATSQSLTIPGVKLKTPKDRPWLAAGLRRETAHVCLNKPSVLMEAGDLERCVAWALLE